MEEKKDWLKVVLRELTDKWQIPVFILGVLLIIGGIWKFVSYQSEHSVEHYITLCEEAYKAGKDVESAKLATILLSKYELKDEEKSKLYSLLSRILYHRERKAEKHKFTRLAKILECLNKVQEIRELEAEEELILADVYEWSGRYKEAVNCLKSALDKGYPDKVGIIRRIIRLLPRTKTDYQFEYDEFLDKFLASQTLSDEDIVWVIGIKTERLFQKKKFKEAIKLIEDALKKVKDEKLRLRLKYSIALGKYYEEKFDLAEPELRRILDQIKTHCELEAKILLILGNICLRDARPVEAIIFFNKIIKTYPLTEYHVSALLGKAEALVTLHRFKDAVRTYKECFRLLSQLGGGRLIDTDLLLRSLEQVSENLHSSGATDQAITFALLQLMWTEKDDAIRRNELYSRLALWNEELAENLSKRIVHIDRLDLIEKMRKQIHNHYREAGRYFLSLADSTGLTNKQSARALWQAITDYEKAEDIENTLRLLERFIHDWPKDNHISLALFKVANMYYTLNRFKSAERYFNQLISEYGRTPWALKARVLLAKTYISMGPNYYQLAEKALLNIVDDTSNQKLFTPESIEFREALFLLGRLYYYEGEYEKSVARLEEALERYKNAPEAAQAKFLMGQCYRKIAEYIRSRLANVDDRVLRTKLVGQWKLHLSYARDLYSSAIQSFESKEKLDNLDKVYKKLSYLYYADCLYDLGEHSLAIKAYETVIDKYPRDVVAISCYVQILNSYHRLGLWSKSKAILERMKWLLNQLPESAFRGSLLSREDWNRWIEWNYKSGLLEYKSPQVFAQGKLPLD